MAFDNVGKILAEKYPTDFARWLLTEEPQTIKVLKTELSIEPIRADSVTFLQTENRILHLEFQTTQKSLTPIPLRMLDYFVRLVRKYDLPITQVVIFLQQTTQDIAFTETYVNEMTNHRYRVVRMWEQEATLFLENPALLALAPLTQTDSPPGLLSQVAQSLAKIADRETRQNIAAYTEILAGLRFEKGLIRQLLSEETMQESVIYQDILQKGEQREAFTYTLRLVNRRFGDIDSSLTERIRSLSTNQLETLGEALFDLTSLADLEAWLNQPKN
ncbi:Rpn family recombination-promoting nuclease/putative transposase [Gloeocapsopsis crepidinum LEGE 06123]|uniref:Rpn family recombination-promoting nuclease/putative transposase n=1 Tax=Gloeocapsopsis crepidinum LEGE 06123 TaxID=588587 RepID=A0ABR9UPA0_9CHRO|nr:DUF4351 domain-containing protein [Gloeocapsopsis crepidinum]MBE9190106.1 Rpn family recombination-promoting nuclease/putative transposase [Gloeocapsopsis crepidinum LEGE 06123]